MCVSIPRNVLYSKCAPTLPQEKHILGTVDCNNGEDLSWKKHVDNTTPKAPRFLGFKVANFGIVEKKSTQRHCSTQPSTTHLRLGPQHQGRHFHSRHNTAQKSKICILTGLPAPSQTKLDTPHYKEVQSASGHVIQGPA